SANSTSPTEPTTPTQPGLQFPSFFPPLDSFFPLELTNIISQLPLSFQSPTLTSTTLPPSLETSSLQPSDDSQKKEANPFLMQLRPYYYESKSDANVGYNSLGWPGMPHTPQELD
ncbi:MAG: hypothetical protein ACK56T_21790, partial [Dolichospermum sp.]